MTWASPATLGIPSDLPAGSYYLIAKADADDVLLESNESNNTYAKPFSVGPDLVVSTVTVPEAAAPGATITATYTVKNQGAMGAGASTVEFFWSTNISLEPGDQSLGATGIGALIPSGTQSGQIALAIPSGVAQGTYYILAQADSAGAVGEAKESNNTKRATIEIGGDLAVSSVSAPSVLGVGVPFTATDTTKNEGGTTVGPSVTHFYLSVNAALSADDEFLGARTVDSLDAGETSTGNTTLTIPDGKPAGFYYLFAKADGPNTVIETEEGNNTAIKSVKVGPDLTVSISSATSPVQAGATSAIRDTVTNKGGNDAGASEIRYYFSTNTVVDASDQLLAETRAVGLLAPNATSTATTPVTIPEGTAPGLYYVIAQADGGAAVAESSESNNTYPRQIRVE
jgi:subtilase family serine protease